MQDSAFRAVAGTATALLDVEYFDNTVRTWLIAAGVFAATLVVLVGIRELVVRRLGALAKRTKTHTDDVIVSVLKRTRYFFLVALSTAGAALTLVLTERVQHILEVAITLAILVQMGLWANQAVDLWLRRLTAEKQAATDLESVTTLNALGILGRIILWTVVFLLALQTFGINVTALVTGLGVAGIAVALAVQNVLGDLLASLAIVLDKPFVVGDFIIVDNLPGTVEEVGLKTTRVRSLGGEQLIFSNADLLKARIRNFKRMQERRILFGYGVEYGTPPEVLRALPGVVKEIVDGIEQARFDRSHFKGFGDSSLDFETVYYVTVPDYATYMDVQQRINLALYDRVQALGASFAFPTRTVWMRSEATPGEESAGAGHPHAPAAAAPPATSPAAPAPSR